MATLIVRLMMLLATGSLQLIDSSLPPRDVLLWLTPGTAAEMEATGEYLRAHKDAFTTISPTLYGLSEDGGLDVNASSPAAESWAASLKADGFKVVPIIWADDSHKPVGLQKLRLLARNPQPFIASIIAQWKLHNWDGINIDIEECHMDAKHLVDCKNQSTTEADSALFIGMLDTVANALHAAGLPLVSVDVDSRVHRQPNPTRFFKYTSLHYRRHCHPPLSPLLTRRRLVGLWQVRDLQRKCGRRLCADGHLRLLVPPLRAFTVLIPWQARHPACIALKGRCVFPTVERCDACAQSRRPGQACFRHMPGLLPQRLRREGARVDVRHLRALRRPEARGLERQR